MAQDDLVKVRLAGGLLGEARAAAGARGLSEWIRDAMREKLEREAQPALLLTDPTPVKPSAGRAPRREPCVHRVPPASFCSRCDG